MQRQHIDALLPLDGVDADQGCLTRELDGSNDGVELCRIEIQFELFKRLPFFDENEGPSPVEIGKETNRATAWRDPGRLDHRSERTQQCSSHSVGRHDLQREDDQELFLSVASASQRSTMPKVRKKRANPVKIRKKPETCAISGQYRIRPRTRIAQRDNRPPEMSETLRNFGVQARTQADMPPAKSARLA